MPKFKELLRVAIVEDDDSYAETLQEYLNKYEQENEVRFQVVRYEDGADLVEKYHGDFDILIMDIYSKSIKKGRLNYAADYIKNRRNDVWNV